MTVEMILQYCLQIAAALTEAHAKGIVHRDVKPGNIMIAKSGVKVLDFGLARSGQDETVTASHILVGTPAYMAPEQRQGKPADTRSDIYSLGGVLYEMSTGARITSQRTRIPSPQLERIVSRCLEEDPGRRWQSSPSCSGNWQPSPPPEAAESARLPPPRVCWCCSPPRHTSISIVPRNAADRTRSSWPISSTTPAILFSTGRFARASRSNWNNRPF